MENKEISMDTTERAGGNPKLSASHITDAHLDMFELSYGGEDRLGDDARVIGYQQNIERQGFEGERRFRTKGGEWYEC